MPMKKIESESAKRLREARVKATKDAQREVERAEREALQQIEQARANDHIGRERAATAARLARQQLNQHLCEHNPFTDAASLVIETDKPTPGVCCMCSKQEKTWGVRFGDIKRSHCRGCLHGQFGRAPKDLTPEGRFKR